MLIHLLTKHRKTTGYIGRDVRGALPYISNGNLCLRRAAVANLGSYDENCRACEDVEICAKISNSNWLMFFCSDMVVFHRARKTIWSVLRQWFWYGAFVPYVFRKYNEGQWEVFLHYVKSDNAGTFDRYRQLVYLEKMPFTVCIFITSFLVFHTFAIAGILALLLNQIYVSSLCGVGAVYFLYDYLLPDLAEGVSFEALKVAGLRYIANVAFFAGHLASGPKERTLYFPHVIDERSRARASLGSWPVLK